MSPVAERTYREAVNDRLPVATVSGACRQPEPPPVDRLALINYATWLAHERRLLCHEIYPGAGRHAGSFIAANVAADDFHFPHDERSWRDVPPPSTRAVHMLDRLGIDWRADVAHRDWHDPQGEPRPAAPVPHGWPAPDAALLEALDDLARLDAAQGAMHTGGDREADTVPGYDALEEARSNALDRLADERAESLIGLQAKAKAILTPSVTDIAGGGDAIAQSLARNLLGLPHSAIEPRPDPIFAAIEESRRLMAAWDAVDQSRTPPASQPSPEWSDASNAFHEHARATLLETVPTTARGCIALARYVAEHRAVQGWVLDEDDPHQARVLALIARSPLI